MYVSPPTQSSLKGVSLEVSAVRLRVRAREGALRVGVARDGGLNLEPHTGPGAQIVVCRGRHGSCSRGPVTGQG